MGRYRKKPIVIEAFQWTCKPDIFDKTYEEVKDA